MTGVLKKRRKFECRDEKAPEQRSRDWSEAAASKGLQRIEGHPFQVVRNPLVHAGDVRDMGSIPWLGRSPAKGNGNPLQYSSLENSTNRGAWQAKVHSIRKSRTQLKLLSTHGHNQKAGRSK